MKTHTLFLIALLMFSSLPQAMTVAVDISEKYTQVLPGEKIYFATEVKWPENDIRRDLRLEYSVKDKNGQEVAYLKVLKAIETQASFMDSISIPENAKPGMYKIYLSLSDYKELNQDVAASFNVESKGLLSTYPYLIPAVAGLATFVIIIELFILIKKKKD